MIVFRPPSHHPEPLEDRIAPANLAFAFGLGNGQKQFVDDVAVDPAGNTYVTGRFQGLVDFDPGPDVQSRLALGADIDGFVAKYDSLGLLSWVDVVRESDKNTNPIHLAVSAKGEAFVFGEFGSGGTSNVSFADRLGQSKFTLGQIGGTADVYLAKIDTSGTFLWATRYGSANDSAAATSSDIAVDGSGGIYLVGTSIATGGAGALSFGAATVNVDAGETDLFVVRVQDDLAPSVTWANDSTSPGIAANVSDLSIAANSAGAVVVRGATDAPLTFATITPTQVTQNLFVGSLDLVGAWSWVDQWAGAASGGTKVAVDAAGGVFVLNDFTGTTDADPGAGTNVFTSSGLEDFYLTKLNAAGTFLFANQYGNDSSNQAGEIAGLDKSGRVFFTGDIGSGAFDVNPSSDSDIVTGRTALLSLRNDGSFVRAEQNATDAKTALETVVVDADGGLHRAGVFAGQFDAGINGTKQTLASKGSTDFFVASYFPGDLVAQDLLQPILKGRFSLGGLGNQEGGPVLTDAAGNLYIVGLFSGTVDFDPGANVSALTSTDPDGNIYVAKYTSQGSLLWARAVEMSLTFDANAPADDLAIHLGLDDVGNVYLAGEYDASAKLGLFTLTNATPAPVGSSRDIFIAKLDPAGTFVWAETLGAAGQNDAIDTFAVHGATGEVALGGSFQGTIDFDPGAGTQNRTAINPTTLQDAYIVTLDTTGAFHWVRQIGGATSQATVKDLAFLSSGDVVATGEFSGNIDFDLGGAGANLVSRATIPGGRDAFAARFTAAAGAVVWRDGFGGSTKEIRPSVTTSAADEIFITGGFTGTADFDPGAGVKFLIESGGGANATSEGDVFLQKLDANGALLGAVGFGGVGGDHSFAVALDGAGGVYVAGKMGRAIDLDPGAGIARLIGSTDNNLFVARFHSGTLEFLSGFRIPAFSPDGDPPGNKGPGLDTSGNGGIHVDTNGHVFVNAAFVGALDLDPAGPLTPLVSKGAHDIVVAEFLPSNVSDAAHPQRFHDANGDLVTIKLTGPGTATYTLIGGAGDLANLASLDLADTNLTTMLAVAAAPFGTGDGASVVQKILTTQTNEHLGTITLGPQITLGDGLADTTVDLRVSGALKVLKLRELAANTILRLGEDLPYDDPDPKVPDTKNNFPSFAIGNVLGAGVQLVVLGKDAPLAGPDAGHGSAGDALHPGGGGLGHLIVGSWAYPGFIRTTQSIGNLNVLTGDFFCTLEIDKFHVGSTTTADVGSMTIEAGSWGSSGSEIEGNVEAFDAEAFLAGAQITAASIGSVLTTTGSFDGMLVLTDPDSSAVPVFTVTTDFTGSVVSASSIKRLVIKGNFTGELEAPSIGSITAYAFLGAHDAFGVPTMTIEATEGALGTLTSTAGVVKDYEIVTDQAFKGIKVKLANLTGDTIGIDNVKITAASIGNISVSLSAKVKEAAGVDLIGIRNSQFTTTAIGTTRATAGTIGNVSVTLTGGAGGGAATGMEDVTFNALVGGILAPDSTINSLGTIAVKISGQDGASLGFDNVSFAANSIGTTRVTVSRGTSLTAAATAIAGADFTTTGAIGALSIGGNATATQVSDLRVWAGGSVGAVTVKATVADYGSLADSAILAGQSLMLNGITAAEQLTKLFLAKLGTIYVSGSLTNSDLIAGGSIGAITVGGSATDSLILAGAMLGGDFTIGANDTYQRAATIGAIVVKGAFTQSSIAAGVDPGDGIFGNADDTIAAVVSLLSNSSALGLVTLSGGSTIAGTAPHQYAIEAAKLTGLKLGVAPAITIPSPLLLDLGTPGEDASDAIVRTIVPS